MRCFTYFNKTFSTSF